MENSKEKQIEEMAKVMCDDCASDVAPCRLNKEGKLCDDVVHQANALYNAGYRKQKEGEWVFKRTYYEADECNCSVCGQLMTTAKGVRMNFCPNCGAKMKGGEG